MTVDEEMNVRDRARKLYKKVTENFKQLGYEPPHDECDIVELMVVFVQKEFNERDKAKKTT